MALKIIAIILASGLVLYLLFQSIYVIVSSFSRIKGFTKRYFDAAFMGSMRNVLYEKNSFYRELSEKGKKKFEKRVIYFMDDMDFEGMQGLQVTDEMMILISSSAIQLTFGLKTYLFTNYITILVYPGPFYSKTIGRTIKGGVAREKIIALSWPDFVSGYETGNDNYNLGLHEMAHALKGEAIYAEQTTLRFRQNFKAWLKLTAEYHDRIKSDRQKYIRHYATTNEDEFFSVCIEYFFESPGEFSRRYPELYSLLSELMNMDPGNSKMDYSFSPDSLISFGIIGQKLR